MTIEMNKMKKDMMDMMSMMSTMNIIVVCLLLVCLHEGALSKKGVLGNGGNIFGQIMTPQCGVRIILIIGHKGHKSLGPPLKGI